MAERDMNQQSVTLADVRRNHQKYKMRMEQPKVKMEQRSAGGMTSQFLTAAFREYDITFYLARNFGVKLKRRFG